MVETQSQQLYSEVKKIKWQELSEAMMGNEDKAQLILDQARRFSLIILEDFPQAESIYKKPSLDANFKPQVKGFSNYENDKAAEFSYVYQGKNCSDKYPELAAELRPTTVSKDSTLKLA